MLFSDFDKNVSRFFELTPSFKFNVCLRTSVKIVPIRVNNKLKKDCLTRVTQSYNLFLAVLLNVYRVAHWKTKDFEKVHNSFVFSLFLSPLSVGYRKKKSIDYISKWNNEKLEKKNIFVLYRSVFLSVATLYLNLTAVESSNRGWYFTWIVKVSLGFQRA